MHGCVFQQIFNLGYSEEIPGHLRRAESIQAEILGCSSVNSIGVVASLSIVSIFHLSRNKWIYHKQIVHGVINKNNLL
jgi:hypothetical protein